MTLAAWPILVNIMSKGDSDGVSPESRSYGDPQLECSRSRYRIARIDGANEALTLAVRLTKFFPAVIGRGSGGASSAAFTIFSFQDSSDGQVGNRQDQAR
ncbi:MAG: hypothetical protein LH610_10775, partial [Sphingomonas bacterium]|nr:hypothetical protein [Sphingomonas bacterium]